MVHVEEQVTIQRPIEEVFAYLTDIPRLPEWSSSVQRVTEISAGPVGGGTTFRHTLKLMGREIDAPMEVTAFEVPHRYEIQGGQRPMHAKLHYELEPEGAGTRVTVTFDGDSAGFFKLADPLIAHTMEKQLQADLATLRAVMESGVAVGAAAT